MMKLTTAGESHGKALVAILEGVPAHLQLNINAIQRELALRQCGFGRGARQKIESDVLEFLSGVRNGETLGSPIAICIFNKDYENWKACMADTACDEHAMETKKMTKVRPGHADLVGMQKFAQEDARNVLERASARETAIRVAAGGIYRQYLDALGVAVTGYVREICGVCDEKEYTFAEILAAKNAETGMLDGGLAERAKAKIVALQADGDTAGGVAEIRVRGLKSGFGSMMTYAEKLDARLAQGLMSIQGVKGVEVGMGFGVAKVSGKHVHDEIFPCEQGGYERKTNRAGGVEGGTSNGEELVLRLAMKPIPTLMSGLRTVDVASGQAAVAAAERSDVCAMVALETIAEAVVSQVLAFAVAERLGGDTMEQVIERYKAL
jgi:chorismate synthase